MSSGIDSTVPAAGSATTLSVRENFVAAKDEINEIQRSAEGMIDTTGSGNAYVAVFANAVTSLTQGLRITVRSNFANDAVDPTLAVNGLTATIIKTADGTSMAAGGIPDNTIVDLIYDLGDDIFVCLNPAHEGRIVAAEATIASLSAITTATDSVEGYIELATAAEVVTGTDSSRALTIAALILNKDLTTVTTTGDQGGITIGDFTVKWGLLTSTTNAAEAFTFDTAFGTHCAAVFTQRTIANKEAVLPVTIKSASGFTIDRSSGFVGSDTFYFLAIGQE